MKILLRVLASALLTAGTAAAQIDPDPHGVGIYFDEAATVNAATAAGSPESPVALTAYLIVTRVSLPGFATHCEGLVEWVGFGLQVSSETISGFDYNMDMPGSNFDSMYVDFLVDTIATGPVMVLKRYDLQVRDSEAAYFYVRSLDLWISGPVQVGPNPSSGEWSRPVAAINAPAPVPTQSASWSEVKHLYR